MKRNAMLRSFIAMLALAALTASGCSVFGLFSKDHDYTVKESWEIKAPAPGLVDAIAETAKSMDFDVENAETGNPAPGLVPGQTARPPLAGVSDSRFKAVVLSRNELTGFKAAFVGSRSASGLTFYAWQDGRYIEVYAMVEGNLGSGKQKAAMDLLSDFRKKLSEKVGEIVVIKAGISPVPA